jgi:hypothetical protein
MRRGPAAALLAIPGYVAGYFAGAFYGCSGPDPSNLCGLWGVFIIGPVGAIAGIVLGLAAGRRS